MVDKKLLAKVPHSPNYPNNCKLDCSTNGYVLGYSTFDPWFAVDIDSGFSSTMNDYFVCGDQKVKNYFIYFHANTKKINLPRLFYYDYGTLYNMPDWNTDLTSPSYTYCLSM